MKICKLGIWDETVPGITFDKDGVSNYAKIQLALMKDFPRGEKGEKDWENIVKNIRSTKGKNQYDCIIGVSGGTDSSYLLHIAKEYGLSPLAVNLDNGWSSRIAVENIKKVTSALDIDLETYVIDYDEIKDLLRAYMRAGLPWADNPTDQAIFSVLYQIANRENIKYILTGADFRSEGKQPAEWTYSDSLQLKYIHKKFGEVKLRSYPIVSYPKKVYYSLVKKIKVVQPFDYLDYDKKGAQKLLMDQYGWEYYGEHHHENLFTKWVIGYWLYEKFNIDKRIITYSAQVLAGKMSREEALSIVSKKPYNILQIEEETIFLLKKLSLSKDEFKNIWESENKSFLDYLSYYKFIKKTSKYLAPLITGIFKVKPKTFYEMEFRQ